MHEPEPYAKGTRLKITPAGEAHLPTWYHRKLATFVGVNEHGEIGIVVNGRKRVEFHATRFWTAA